MDNDSPLMDAFIKLHKQKQNTPQRITSNDIHNVNEVRLFLKCTFLSDLLGDDGKIKRDIYDAISPCKTTESYPNRTRPHNFAVTAWQWCLQGAFISGDRDILPSLRQVEKTSNTPDAHQEPHTISKYITRQPQHIQNILGQMYSDRDLQDIDNIYCCLKDSQDIDVYGNGTVKNCKGAHYYTIKPAICEDPKSLGLHGGAKTSSNSSGIVSLRPESFSIVAALNITKATMAVNGVHSSESRLIFWYDNTESL